MASITTRQTGRGSGSRSITFNIGGGLRRTIILGDVPMKVAKEICTRVEYLAAAKGAGVAIDADTAAWVANVAKVNPVLHGKLAKVGLVEPLATPEQTIAATLDGFVTSYIDGLAIKPRTRENLHQARRWLVDFFGADKPLDAITQGDADDWR